MLSSNAFNLGIMFRREHDPKHLPEFARRAERAGFDELWVVEDCFYGSGVASAAAALAVTDTITVGVGIMPAVARNPVFTAMEIATLARLFPGRLLPGIGHGVAGWMRQIGAFPKSQLAALEETTVAVRRLLAGERFSFAGKQVQLDDVALVHPPVVVPPISLGVRGPKSLALSGRAADGTVLAEFAPPSYVKWAGEQIETGRAEAGRSGKHRLTVFAFASACESPAEARQELRPLIAPAIASGKINAHIAPMGILSQVRELLESGGQEQLETDMPGAWIDQLAMIGTPHDWRTAANRLVAAGADTVVLVPLPGKGLDELDAFARHFAP
jgi:alkanesulfonate monooxygenase SsuD/methylene tetrahydromethanopterin reductase-like flavin-dependent oxidoreductase (luciferase family)